MSQKKVDTVQAMVFVLITCYFSTYGPDRPRTESVFLGARTSQVLSIFLVSTTKIARQSPLIKEQYIALAATTIIRLLALRSIKCCNIISYWLLFTQSSRLRLSFMPIPHTTTKSTAILIIHCFLHNNYYTFSLYKLGN